MAMGGFDERHLLGVVLQTAGATAITWVGGSWGILGCLGALMDFAAGLTSLTGGANASNKIALLILAGGRWSLT